MKKSMKYLLMFSLLIMVFSLACAAARQTVERVPAAPPAPASPAMKGFAQESDSASSSNAGTGTGVDRKIVRTGTLTLQVKDIAKAQDEVTAIASQMNGFVVSSNQRADDDEDPRGYISIRVPAERFNEALQKIRALSVKVVYENTNSQDVTEQYTDLKAQLKNYEATEAQYLELMKKAENVKDILEVQRELSNVRGNIERVKGRIQYIDRTSDMSLIEVTLNKAKPIGESTWDVMGIVKAAVDGLIVFGKILIGIIVWLLVFSPVWIIVIVIIWLVRRKKRNKPTTAA
jgi:hypothetical protein